jgi:hypothetical protein
MGRFIGFHEFSFVVGMFRDKIWKEEIMTIKQVEEKLTELVHREPFIPLILDMRDGSSLIVPHPPAFNESGAVFFNQDGVLVDFWFRNVRAIRFLGSEAVA